METLLQINASLFSNHGQSSRLADEFVAARQAKHPGSRVLRRDLSQEPVPHLRPAARLSSKVRDVPSLFPEACSAGRYPWRNQVKLVVG